MRFQTARWGVAGTLTGDVLSAYQEVWRVMELLRLVVGSPHWWDATFSGSVASTLPLLACVLRDVAVPGGVRHRVHQATRPLGVQCGARLFVGRLWLPHYVQTDERM